MAPGLICCFIVILLKKMTSNEKLFSHNLTFEVQLGLKIQRFNDTGGIIEMQKNS